MKRTLLFCLLATCGASLPLAAHAQSFVNPDTIQQAGDIFLQNTDVYYCPFRPPASTDARDSLSNQYSLISNPNGVGNPWDYAPQTHGVTLRDWCPCYDTMRGGVYPYRQPLGRFVLWQRLFTANRKADSSASDIVVGSHVTTHHDTGRVTISKNEDVDFRASGTIKMENGFHVMPGAFFHAYIEPKWDTTVFADEFDASTLDRSKWYVSRGWGDVENTAQCSSDSDARTVTDTEAHDGHALDLDLREDTSLCSCLDMAFNTSDNCAGAIRSDTIHYFAFSTANIRSCPMPWLSASRPYTPYYQHAPYGKYEIREKIPHVMHHTNDWGFNGWEWGMGETGPPSDSMKTREIGVGLYLRHGPFKGKFGSVAGDTFHVFRSGEAHFSLVNKPTRIFINNFLYTVSLNLTPYDTFLVADGTSPGPLHSFPSSLASDTTDFFTFNYERDVNNVADTLSWRVDTASDGTRRIFSAPYHVVGGISQYFSKDYQPTSLTLTTKTSPHDTAKNFACHWDHTLNKIWLDKPIPPSDIDSNTEAYSYTIDEGYGIYPTPWLPFDGNDTTGGYVYHTYTMEVLPHELRYLIDGNVVRRFPDRLVPRNNKYYDRISDVPRIATYLDPAEIGFHSGTYTDSTGTHTDSLGVHPGTDAYMERQYFEHINSKADSLKRKLGVWDVNIGGRPYPAAHHLLDYVKIWDVPKDVKVPDFPQ